MTNSKLVPRRRFKEFESDDEWEKRKLGDLSNITAGGDVDKAKLMPVGNFPVLANAHTGDGIIGYYDNEYQIEAPAVTVTGRGEIGFAKARRENFTPVVRLLSVKSNHNVDFLAEAINQNKVIFESTGVPQLTIPKLSNYNLFFPSKIEEENTIGDFMRTIDNVIAINQHKLDKLKNLKKAYLSEMFPAEGECVPKRRFPGFEGEWEERKLTEVTEVITKGTTPKDKNWNGSVNYIKTESINSESGKLVRTSSTTLEEHEGYLSRSKLKTGDVLFSIVGTLGRVGIVEEEDLPANTNQQIAIIRLLSPSSEFVMYSLKTTSVKSFIKTDATIGAQPSISLWQIEELKLLFPTITEQEAISSYFKVLDRLITLQQQKLDKLNDLKKAYLNELFV